MRVLVTGVAGFIGMHVAERLLRGGHTVVGIDDLNDYYDVSLKRARLDRLVRLPGFSFQRLDVADTGAVTATFGRFVPSHVVHLAAQAGVRHSQANPHVYVRTNVQGFLNVLEGCREVGAAHLVYASSSSVYGANAAVPYSEHQPADHPVSVYGATKKANEMFAHAYSHTYGLPTTGLRFFTVYGPWGRPDMAPMLFARAILAGEPIKLFNGGRMLRDFTYIDDVAEAVCRVLALPAAPNPAFNPLCPDPASSLAPYRIYNVGNDSPVPLLEFVEALERALGKKAIKELLPMQPGDMVATHADSDDLGLGVGFRPATTLETGLRSFAGWYRAFYGARTCAASPAA